MRNIFDQYEQPENRLTHALVCTLASEPRLLRPFLRWIGARDVPPLSHLRIVEQHVPGTAVSGEEPESRGLPDACIYDDEGWACIIETKVQAGINVGQLRRHLATAKRHGYEDPHLVVIAVDRADGKPPAGARVIEWCKVYGWFRRYGSQSTWARICRDYMRAFEARMIAEEYAIRGTLTMFDGLHFDEDNPYTYREGKRLIRLLGDELQNRKDLRAIGVDPNGSRRPAITGKGADAVWDFLPLKIARSAANFTDFPHLTMGIAREGAVAALTVPNGVKGGFRTKLKATGAEGFRALMEELETSLRLLLRRSPSAKPLAYVTQRHYASQRTRPEVDARLDADLRTLVRGGRGGVRYQPEWIHSIYDLLIKKRSNIQLGIEVRFKYDCPIVRSARAVDLFAETWIASHPLVEFVVSP